MQKGFKANKFLFCFPLLAFLLSRPATARRWVWHWKIAKRSSMEFINLSFVPPQNGLWHQSPGNQGWGGNRSRKSSVIDADNLPSSSLKPSAGRVIRIINNNDHSVQVRALLKPWRKALEKFKFNYPRLAASVISAKWGKLFSTTRAFKFTFFVSTMAHKAPAPRLRNQWENLHNI